MVYWRRRGVLLSSHDARTKGSGFIDVDRVHRLQSEIAWRARDALLGPALVGGRKIDDGFAIDPKILVEADHGIPQDGAVKRHQQRSVAPILDAAGAEGSSLLLAILVRVIAA